MKTKKPPLFDVNHYAFADEETVRKACEKYADDIKNYQVKRATPWLLCMLALILTVYIATVYLSYHKGFKDNQPIADDNSPVVYITSSGDKYHLRNCKYITSNNAIEISLTQAKNKSYTSCSVCKAENYYN